MVTRDAGNVTIDFTCKLLVEIQEKMLEYQRSVPQMQDMVQISSSRLIGQIIVRVASPLATMKRGAIPSPSAIAADQMLLPYMRKNGKILLRPETKPEPVKIINLVPSVDNNPYEISRLKVQNYKPVPVIHSKITYRVKTI